MIHRPARNTTTTLTFWACDEANVGGVLGVRINGGGITTGDTLGSGTDYTGLVTATGLSAGTTYTYQLTLAGSDVTGATGTVSTLPAAGSNADILIATDLLEPAAPASIMCADGVHHAAYTSELFYVEKGEYSAAPASAATMASLRTAHDEYASSAAMTSAAFQAFRNSYRSKFRYAHLRDASVSNKWTRKLLQKYPWRIMWDNHESWTPDGTQGPSSEQMPRPGSNQFDGAMRANWEYFFQGNPVNPDTVIDTQPTRDGSTVFTPYFREAVADVEMIVLDEISFSDFPNAGATFEDIRTLSNGARGGFDQKAWLTTRIANSSAKFIVIFAGRGHQYTAGATNDWEGASGILSAIESYPGKTIVVIEGDTHRPLARLIQHPSWCPNGVLMVNPGTVRNVSMKDAVLVGNSSSNETRYFDPMGTDGGGTPGNKTQSGYSSIYAVGGRGNFVANGGQIPSSLTPNLLGCGWTYVRLLSRPNGSSDYATSHLRIEIRNAMSRALRWYAIVPEGSKVPYTQVTVG